MIGLIVKAGLGVAATGAGLVLASVAGGKTVETVFEIKDTVKAKVATKKAAKEVEVCENEVCDCEVEG